MEQPPYKRIKVYCTSGTVVRESLISEWYTVHMESGEKIEAYYHRFHGWMKRGETDGSYRYGYIPVKEKVIKWN